MFVSITCRTGAVHLVLQGSAHDTFNDAVQLVALRYRTAMQYVRSFKQVCSSFQLRTTQSYNTRAWSFAAGSCYFALLKYKTCL